MSWPCIWVERAGEAERSLRRYSHIDEPCPADGRSFHGATTPIGTGKLQVNADGTYPADVSDVAPDDPRWPTACRCGYIFTGDDSRQVQQDPIYRANDGDGRGWPSRSLPPGAMFDGVWHTQKGPDGIALVVVLPPAAQDTRSHWWHVDGPSRNNGVPGPGWTRTGDPRDPPTLSVSPSILTDRYHGFLTAGVLTDSLSDRPL